MRKAFAAGLVFLVVLFVGCGSNPKGPNFVDLGEFKRELSDTVPVKKYGYTVKDVRLSPDRQQALVIFTHRDSDVRPEWEFILKRDDFRRYQGASIQPFYTPGTAQTPRVFITVDMGGP